MYQSSATQLRLKMECAKGDIKQYVSSVEEGEAAFKYQTKRYHQNSNQEVHHCRGNHKSVGGLWKQISYDSW